MISLLVAMSRDHVIGFENDMPWNLPNDLKFFKEKTTGHSIIMGRKTFESIGRVLPNRKNIVLTRGGTELPNEVEIVHDLDVVLQWNNQHPKEEYFVVGGGNIYKQFLPYADRMYITLIDEAFEGDTVFPEFSEAEWELTSKEQGLKNEANPYDYHFLQYDRK